jgi:DUF1680 family protein
MMPTWVYAKSADGVYVNLFVGSTITVENVGGTDVEMVQATDYPWNGKVAITVNPQVARNFSVRVRVPNHDHSSLYESTPQIGGLTSLAVNGVAVPHTVEKGYAVITRTWKAGDKIELVAPLKVQRVRASTRIAADQNKVALRYGPLMYSIEKVDQDITKSLKPDSALNTEWRKDLLGGVMVIKGEFADGSPMMAIPNYARANRDPAPAPRVATPADGGGRGRGFRPQPNSVVWIKEG